MTCLAVWIAASLVVGLLWAWWNRDREQSPNQWQRYRGVMHLREHVDQAPPMNTALLVRHLATPTPAESRSYFLPEPLTCGQCRHATMIVHRGDDGGARCPSC